MRLVNENCLITFICYNFDIHNAFNFKFLGVLHGILNKLVLINL
jgi:hypothetical protein